MLLFAQLQSVIECGSEIEFRPEVSHRIESAGAYQGQLRAAQRLHDDAVEQPKTRRFLLSRPMRKICRLKLFDGRVKK